MIKQHCKEGELELKITQNHRSKKCYPQKSWYQVTSTDWNQPLWLLPSTIKPVQSINYSTFRLMYSPCVFQFVQLLMPSCSSHQNLWWEGTNLVDVSFQEFRAPGAIPAFQKHCPVLQILLRPDFVDHSGSWQDRLVIVIIITVVKVWQITLQGWIDKRKGEKLCQIALKNSPWSSPA